MSNKKYIPYCWTYIRHAFGPMEYSLNKRSGKLRIVTQIIRMTIFVLTYIYLIRSGDKPLLNLCILTTRYWIFLSWKETEPSFSKTSQKVTVCHYKLYVNIFHKACSFFHLFCHCDTSKVLDSNWPDNWKRRSWKCVFYSSIYSS